MYTVNANDPDLTKIVWLSMNSGLTTLQAHGINNIVITPNGTLYLLTQNALVFVASSLGGLWTELYSSTEYPLDGPGYICGIGVNPLEDDQIAIFGGNLHRLSPLDMGMSYLALANIGGVGDLNNAVSIHGYYSTVLYNNNGWTVYCSAIGGMLGNTPRSVQVLFESDGATISVTDVPGGEGPMGASNQYGHSLGTSNRTLQWVSQLAYNYGFFDFTDATPTNVTSLYPKRRQAMSFSPTGNFGMGCDGGLFTAKWTSDGGATWLTTTLPVGSSVWENCKDDNRWLFGGGTNIQVSLDRGGTSGANLIGNLVYAAPLINIVGIRFIE
jgi:hypothetical protein